MLFDRLIRRIGRTARGSAAKKHQVVYYDIRINNIESAWSSVRVVWISGTGKQTRSDAVPVADTTAHLDGGVTVPHTLYKAQDEFLPKTVQIAIDAQAVASDASAPFVRLASLYLDIGTMCNGSHKGIVVTDARSNRPGAAADKVYQVQMRIEVPGLAAEKADTRGASGLDQLTTVSSYQDSLMFTSAPADLAHGPDGGKGPDLEVVALESMSNLSEGHMPRTHGHDRHGGGHGGDSTGDLALAHYDERHGQSSMLSEHPEAAVPRLGRRASTHSSLTSEDLDDYDPGEPVEDGRSKISASQGISPHAKVNTSGTTPVATIATIPVATSPAALQSSPKAGSAHASPGHRSAGLAGMHSPASELLAAVVEDPMDTAGAASAEAVHVGKDPGGEDSDQSARVEHKPATHAEGGDWQAGVHSASMPLEEDVAGTASGAIHADGQSPPFAARHDRRRTGTAAAAATRSTRPAGGLPGQRQTLQNRKSAAVSVEARPRTAGDRRAPGSLRKPTGTSVPSRRGPPQGDTVTPAKTRAAPSAAVASSRTRLSLGSASATSTPARSTAASRVSTPASTRSALHTPRTTPSTRPPARTPSSAGRPQRTTAALRGSMESAVRPSPARKAPLDTGLPLKQKMIVRRDPLLYRKAQLQVHASAQGGSQGSGSSGQGLGERRERRSTGAAVNGRRPRDVSPMAPPGSAAALSRGNTAAAFELALDVHKHKGPTGQARSAGQPRWVSKATQARRQQRQQTVQQQDAKRANIASGTSAFGTRVPSLRAAVAAADSQGYPSPPVSSTSMASATATSPAPTATSPAPASTSRAQATTSPHTSCPPAAGSLSPPAQSSPPPPSGSPIASPSKASSSSFSPEQCQSLARSPSLSPAKSPTASPTKAVPALPQTPPAHGPAQVPAEPLTPLRLPATNAATADSAAAPSGPRLNNLSLVPSTDAADAGRDSPTCRTDVSSLSAVPLTQGDGVVEPSLGSPTRSQAGVSEVSIEIAEEPSPIDIIGEVNPTAMTVRIVSGRIGTGELHDLPERQSASTFIQEISSHVSSLRSSGDGCSGAEGGVEGEHTAAAAAAAAPEDGGDRANGAAAVAGVNGRVGVPVAPPSSAASSERGGGGSGGALEPAAGTSRMSGLSHASGGPLSGLDAAESGSSSISTSCQMGPTASRASSDYAGTEYAATGQFVDSIVDGQVLGWMNATSTAYDQPE